jgi:hypothetical protein
MEDVVPCLIVALVGIAGATFKLGSIDPKLHAFVWAGLFAHFASALAQVQITLGYYGMGDMVMYFETGRALAQLMALNPETYVPEVFAYFFQMPVSLPVGQELAESATGSMTAASAVILVITRHSLWASCLAVGTAAFFAKLALCGVLWERMEERCARHVVIAVLLLPSAAFWSSALLKESLAVVGLATLLVGAYRLKERRFVRSGLSIVGGTLLVAMLKPYILLPTACAVTIWLYFGGALEESKRRPVRLRAVVVLPGMASLVAVVLLFGRVFPAFGVDRFAEDAATYQELGVQFAGGSSFVFGDPSERSLMGQLAFAPIGFFNVLFRPLFFEVRNVVMAMNAVETTLFAGAFLVIAVGRRWRVVVERVLSSPELAFCAIFALTMGLGVGLTTTNLGTLSRYRMPMMPFLALLMLVVSEKERALRTEIPALVRSPRGPWVQRQVRPSGGNQRQKSRLRS